MPLSFLNFWDLVLKTSFQVAFLLKISKFLSYKICKFLTASTNQNCEFLCSKLSVSLDQCLINVSLIETRKFSIFKFLSDQSFHASFVIEFTCIVLFSLSILHFCSHITHYFSHTTHIHFTKLGTHRCKAVGYRDGRRADLPAARPRKPGDHAAEWRRQRRTPCAHPR